MKKKRNRLLFVGFFFILAFSSIIFLYDHVHYNRAKDNIFEIPKTYNLWKSGNTMRYEKYYFIQSPPKSQQKLENIIRDFINQNKVLEDAVEEGADYIALNFMIPDYNLPIYFEENNNYYKMDDRIKHYIETNRIALYTYNFEDDIENLAISLE